MGSVALDSSVLIALLDPADAHHVPASRALARVRTAGEPVTISAVVLAECMVALLRHDPGGADERLDGLTRLFGPARPVDATVATEAARLRARLSWLRMPDALVLATAEIDGTDVLLTCDRRLGKASGRVQVVGSRASRGR